MTLAELRALGLQKYGIYAAGETASSEDAETVDEGLTAALAELATPSVDIAVWAIDDTPYAYAHAFIDYSASNWLGGFNGVEYPADKLESMRRVGLSRLRELTRGSRSSAPGTAEYF